MTLGSTYSKTDQFRQGKEVLASHTDSVTCPVLMLEQYNLVAKLDMKSELRLFREISNGKNVEKKWYAKGNYFQSWWCYSCTCMSTIKAWEVAFRKCEGWVYIRLGRGSFGSDQTLDFVIKYPCYYVGSPLFVVSTVF